MVIRERDEHVCVYRRAESRVKNKIKQRVTLNVLDTRFSILLENINNIMISSGMKCMIETSHKIANRKKKKFTSI